MGNPQEKSYHILQKIALVLGPAVLLWTAFSNPPAGLSPAAWQVLGCVVIMALWWLTEAVPISVTSLLPLVLFPSFNVASIKAAAAPYAHHLIFMFLGGFIIAAGMQRWNLHRRIAITIVAWVGQKPAKIIFGFMLASAFLSMWMSNTAVTLMMIPIAILAIQVVRDDPDNSGKDKSVRNFTVGLLLAVAYGATIGGVSTLIGTPPNAFLSSFMEETYNYNLAFSDWMKIGVPMMIILLPLTWFLITRVLYPIKELDSSDSFQKLIAEKESLGPMSAPEIKVAAIFFLVAGLWMFQKMINPIFPSIQISNASIAMVGALLMFVIPVNLKKGQFLLDKSWSKMVEWDVLVLFGGGLSLSSQIGKSGLAKWIADQMAVFGTLDPILVIFLVTLIIVFLTEITSNTATATTFVPILAAMAIGLGENPLFFMLPITLGASCAFMLPVATPPNAIVFSSGELHIKDMIRAGLWLNILSIILITIVVYFLGTKLFGIEMGVIPAWVNG